MQGCKDEFISKDKEWRKLIIELKSQRVNLTTEIAQIAGLILKVSSLSPWGGLLRLCDAGAGPHATAAAISVHSRVQDRY